MRIVSVGEVLWDVFGGSESLGGAPLNLAVHAARLGHACVMVSAVGQDVRGRVALSVLQGLGLSTRYVHSTSCAPTGVVHVIVDDAGQPSYSVVRPAAYDYTSLSERQINAIARGAPDALVFGTLAQQSPSVRVVTGRLVERCRIPLRLYDLNLRAGCYTPALIVDLMGLASVVKLNADEADELRQIVAIRSRSCHSFCRRLSSLLGLRAVALTHGADGCCLLVEGQFAEVEGVAVDVVDTVGAGDAFGAALIHGIHLGWPVHETARFANAVGALVASRSGGMADWSVEDVKRLLQQDHRPDLSGRCKAQ
jgi:fructokinase